MNCSGAETRKAEEECANAGAQRGMKREPISASTRRKSSDGVTASVRRISNSLLTPRALHDFITPAMSFPPLPLQQRGHPDPEILSSPSFLSAFGGGWARSPRTTARPLPWCINVQGLLQLTLFADKLQHCQKILIIPFLPRQRVNSPRCLSA